MKIALATLAGSLALAGLAGCINTQSYDRGAAWSACSDETDKAARDACISDHMADASAERAEWKRELEAEEASRDQRAGELEALGVPEGDRSTGPVRDGG